jgi:hypothetical protein
MMVRRKQAMRCLSPDCWTEQNSVGVVGMTVDEAMAALQCNPEDPDSWAALGAAFIGVGERDNAWKSYHTALGFRPEHSVALAELAQLEAPTGMYDAWLWRHLVLGKARQRRPTLPRSR